MSPSWRDQYRVHPAAELFPMMSATELIELGEDIRTKGLTSPIVFIAVPGGLAVLDGRNRLDAMAMAGMDPVWESKQRRLVLPANTDPFGFVISANIHRRHITAEQKRELIAELLKADPEKSNRQIAEIAKVDHKTVGAVRTATEARGEIPHVEVTIDSKGRRQPNKKPTKAPIIPADKAADIIRGNPSASVRFLSRATGLSSAAIKRLRGEQRPKVETPEALSKAKEVERSNQRWAFTRNIIDAVRGLDRPPEQAPEFIAKFDHKLLQSLDEDVSPARLRRAAAFAIALADALEDITFGGGHA